VFLIYRSVAGAGRQGAPRRGQVPARVALWALALPRPTDRGCAVLRPLGYEPRGMQSKAPAFTAVQRKAMTR